jgi:hypothetical protein
MSTTVLLAALTLSAQPGAKADASLVWKPYTAPNGWFSASFPGSPAVQKIKVPAPIGTLAPTGYVVDLGNGRGFLVVDMELPEVAAKRLDERIIKSAFDEARRHLLRQNGGRLVAQNELILNGCSGRDFRIELPDSTQGGSGELWLRFLVVGNHFLQYGVQAPYSTFSTEDAEFFLDSFRVPHARGTRRDFDWKAYGSDEAGFQALLPGPPVAGMVTIATPEGPAQLVSQSVPREPYEFAVTYLDVPDVERRPTPEAVYGAARDRLVRRLKGRVVADRAVTLDGIAGRELQVEIPESRVAGGGILWARSFLSQRRLYQFTFEAPKSAPYPEGRDAFFNSLHLTPRPSSGEDSSGN